MGMKADSSPRGMRGTPLRTIRTEYDGATLVRGARGGDGARADADVERALRMNAYAASPCGEAGGDGGSGGGPATASARPAMYAVSLAVGGGGGAEGAATLGGNGGGGGAATTARVCAAPPLTKRATRFK